MRVAKKIKGRSVFFRLFGSYLLILGLILAVQTGSTFKILETSREQAGTLNKSLMQLVKNECDNQIRNVYRMLDLLAFDDRVQSLSGIRGQIQSDKQYTAYSLYEELLNLNLSLEGQGLMYVYFKNLDWVVSNAGNMSLEMYHRLYYADMDISLEELREYLCEKHYHDINVIMAEQDKREIMYTMTSLKTDVGEPTATMVIQITPKLIDERISAAKWNDDILVAVMNSSNEFLNDMNFLKDTEELHFSDIPTDENFFTELGGCSYMGIAMESEQADWIYILLTPRDVIENGARQAERYCVIGIIVCLVAGFLVSYVLTSRNYTPIRGLMELFRKVPKEAGMPASGNAENEYQWLERQAKQFFREHEDVRRTLDKNQKQLGEFCLYKLLSHPYEELDVSEIELLRRNGIAEGILRVVFLSVGIPPEKEQAAEIPATEDGMTLELQRFIIKNVAGETLNEVFRTEMLEAESYVIGLVHLEEMNTANYDKMWGALGKAFDLIRDKFHFYMQICTGTAKLGAENVYSSYLEAKETQEYASLLDTYFINYTDIQNRSKKYYYPKEAEVRIIYALSAGKPEAAIQCVEEILRTNYEENHIAAKLLPCLIYDLLGTLMKAADEMGCGDFFERYWTEKESFEKLPQKTPDEVIGQFARLITALCSDQEQGKQLGDTQLADQIQAYITENFQNPDLNISQVAFYFEKTPAYISSAYKKQTGKSLLKCITQMRVEHAIRLLGEGRSVNETATLSGFRDSRSFIRVFKDYTGVTPGQMRRE